VVSDRSKWTAIDNKTRKEVLERDGNMCLVCGSRNFLTLAHIFINRSHGGRGCKENLVCLCARHHEILDNPLGEKENEFSKKIEQYCKNYLIKKESIDYNKEFLNNLVFSKSPK
jgi:predicted restriction endonuclease